MANGWFSGIIVGWTLSSNFPALSLTIANSFITFLNSLAYCISIDSILLIPSLYTFSTLILVPNANEEG